MLTGIRVEFGAARITLAATDRYRLAVREVPWTPADTDRDLPAPIVAAGADLMRAIAGFDESGQVGVSFTGKEFGVFHGEKAALAGLLDIGYTDFRKLRPAAPETRVTVETAVLRGAVEDAIPDTEPGTRMEMAVENGGFFISRQSDADATRPAWVRAEVDGDPLRLLLSPRYLLDALLTSTAARVSLAFTGPYSPVIIAPADGSSADELSWYCLMPMRMGS
jgi:DNA polymerase III subunit beta